MIFGRKTDLALEVHEINAEKGKDDGIIIKESEQNGFKTTEVIIKKGKGEKLSGKKEGTYITVDVGKIWMREKSYLRAASNTICTVIKRLLPEDVDFSDEACLVAGLGNEKITVDSIGPGVVSELIITRHLKQLDPVLYKDSGFGCVAAVSAGVLGSTGIESAEIVKSAVNTVKPKCVIVIDAFASRRVERLATTVQISDTGISPGSGVGNHRDEISADTLGIPVIAIGIPTVVDSATLVCDLLESCEEAEEPIKKAFAENGKSFFVSLKESDMIISSAVKLLALAVNSALHKGLAPSEIEDLTGF